ncbi:MAG: hypothetical protein RMK29_16635 [Myxococcales bacterium]|nr:hypothetical protein [Myxococcota bacterium]MDW8283335.1 hypothetical protein [Myxococcales bacterium]
MVAKEVGREFLSRACEYLISLPFDVKALQEAVSNQDLEREARELAAGVVIYTLNHHQEGNGIERFIDSVFLVRIAFEQVVLRGGEGSHAFRERFAEIYGALDRDIDVFRSYLGPELWSWLNGRLPAFSRLTLKGKRPRQYVDDTEALDQLYEDCLDFQTNYNITEAQVQNRLRRPEQIAEYLQRRHAEDSKKRS